MHHKILTLTALGAALAALAGGSVAAQAQDVTLRWHTFVPPVSNPSKFYVPWAEKIEKESGGRLKIQLFWAMQLGGKAPQLLDQAREGVVDIVWTLPGFTPGRMPSVEPFELPFVHKDAMSSTLAMQDYQDMHLAEDYKDYHPLLTHSHAGFLFQTKQPIRTMDDLKGLKLRAASRGGVWLLEALGATGIGLPLPEIPAALSKGVIDGVTLPYEIAPAVKTPELVSNFSELAGPQPRLGTNVFTLLMNKKAWDSLPPDLQKVLVDNSGRNVAKWAGQVWTDIEQPGKAAAAALPKNQFHTIPEAEVAKMKKAAEPVFARWFEEVGKQGIDGPKLLDDARKLIDKYSN